MSGELTDRLRRYRWTIGGVAVGLVLGTVGLAVLGTFVLGVDQHHDITPAASFDVDRYPNGSVRVTHTGGDRFTEENTGAVVVEVAAGEYPAGDDPEAEFRLPASAGDSVLVGGVPRNGTVWVIWTSPGGEKSQALARFEGPGDEDPDDRIRGWLP